MAFWDSARQWLGNAYSKVKSFTGNLWHHVKNYLPTDIKEGAEKIGNAVDSVFNKSNSAPSEFPDRPLPLRSPNYKLQPIDPRASSESTKNIPPPWVLERIKKREARQ